jgi:hypothetical protein
MLTRVHVADERTILQAIRKEVLRELRKEANRLRRYVRAEAPKDTGNLAKKLRVRTGWDAAGPYSRVLTGARRTTRDEDGTVTSTFRYGLALQQRTHFLQRGLQRTPRR